MGQTSGSNAGNLELLKKIDEIKSKKIFKTYFASSGTSLWNVLKEIIKSDDVACTIIFNNPSENVFADKDIPSGVLSIYYSSAYWRDHPQYNLQSGGNIYTGSIDVTSNTLDAFVQQATRNFLLPSSIQAGSGALRYCKAGNLVMLSCGGNIPQAAAGEWTIIHTLPEGYRPSFGIHFSASFDSQAESIGTAKVDTNGEVSVFCTKAVSSAWFTVTFPTIE